MTALIFALILLGIVAQGWLLYELQYDLPIFAASGELVIYFLPITLAVAGASLATWLRRRGSGWAWPAAGLPAIILVLGLGLAVALTANPIVLHQR